MHLITSYLIGYDVSNNKWSTGAVPFAQYSEKLGEARREKDMLPSYHSLERSETEHIASLLRMKEKELHEVKKEKEEMRVKIKKDIMEKDRQLNKLDLQLEKTEKQFKLKQKELLEREHKQLKANQHQKTGLTKKQKVENKSREQEIQQKIQEIKGREKILEHLLEQAEQEFYLCLEKEKSLRQKLMDKNSTAKLTKNDCSWAISTDNIIVTDKILGKGALGEVKLVHFCGLKTAAKVFHDVIISEYNISVFAREMDIISTIRHPNLLQFIGATIEGSLIILTELMPTSLRKKLEISDPPLSYPAILSISLDVAHALNYLHLLKPHSIIHRDVSSANVLLQPVGGYGNMLRAKLSDYGSANLQPLVGKTTLSGDPLYAAPEAINPKDHSPAMDVFSYGVLLIEIISCHLPLQTERLKLIDAAIKDDSLKRLVQECLTEEYKERPSMKSILAELNVSF